MNATMADALREAARAVTSVVRPAAAGDHPQLCELFDELDALHRDARPDIFRKPAGDARSRDDIASLVAGEGGAILVADSGDRLLGVAVALLRHPRSHPLLIARKIVEIDNVVVRGVYQRQGIGRRLVAACVDWARQRGADDVEIAVHDFNIGAAAFYVALGFEMSVHLLRRPLR
ncbi:MAG TPA: GNAT family N-acetyltransferase [Xanthobacteraceae bacterium]|nr:GNAT family N-acetyltransferase [Xanthobacteraceae bacterium]